MHLTRHYVFGALFAGTAFAFAFWSTSALADKRVALVIGNSNYQQVPKLANPSADANAIAQLLKNAGFERVDLQIDLGNSAFKRAIRNFGDAARDADMAVIFFAGHGIEV